MTGRKRIVITGANGFTGIHACRHFQEQGYEVIGAVRKKTGLSPTEVEIGDLTDHTCVFNLINIYKPEYVLHLAGQNHVQNSWMNPIMTMEANMMSTLYMLEAIRKMGLECRIVVAGSALQYDPSIIPFPPHPYSLSKTMQVLVAKSWSDLYKMDIVIAKPSNLIGPGLSNGICSIFGKKIVSMEMGQTDKTLEVHNIEVHRDFLDVRDAVKAYEILLKYGITGEEYEIGSGQSRSLKEVVQTFRKWSKTDFLLKSLKNGIQEAPLNINIGKISSIGFKPSISFESSVKDILMFYRNIQEG
jgi:GDP-4-dehydro-6-deoxy-D-mannose reductase